MGDWVDGINLSDIHDELKLHEMLDAAQDYEDRKKVRARLKDVIAQNRAQREEMIRRREDEREETIRARLRDADEQKKRTMAMYDAMAKSAPAGGNKTLDVNILREGRGSGHSTPTRIEPVGGPKVDLVEQAIRERQKEADDRKKRILTAYDNAAKSGPAGATRFIDLESVKPSDVQNYQPKPTPYSSTFKMSGGIPQSFPGGTQPFLPRRPESEAPYDPMEEAIRRRQKEADDRKRRTLEAYDKAAKSRPAGEPVSIYIPYDDDVAPVIEVVGRQNRIIQGTPASQKTEAASSRPVHASYNLKLQQPPAKAPAPAPAPKPAPVSKPAPPQPQQNRPQPPQQTPQQYRNANNALPPQRQIQEQHQSVTITAPGIKKVPPQVPPQAKTAATVNVTTNQSRSATGNQQTTTTTTTTRREYYEESEEEESEEEDYE